MSDRYALIPISDPFPNGWVQLVDTKTMTAALAGAVEYREQLQAACDQLNARDRLASGGSLAGEDVVERVEPAECGDTFGVGPRTDGVPWPFARGEGNERYRWRYIACGTTAVHRTNAAGLQLLGRVVRRQTAVGEQRLVQLVDRDGTVFASVVGLSESIEQAVKDARNTHPGWSPTGRLTPESMRDALRSVEQREPGIGWP